MNNRSFIQLDMPVSREIIHRFMEEVEEDLTDEQAAIWEDNCVGVANDGYGSIRIDWRVDDDGNLAPELDAMIDDLNETNFFYELETVQDIIFHLSEDGFWDGFLSEDDEDTKAAMAEQHIKTRFKYYPGAKPETILRDFSEEGYDASTIMASVLFTMDLKEAA